MRKWSISTSGDFDRRGLGRVHAEKVPATAELGFIALAWHVAVRLGRGSAVRVVARSTPALRVRGIAKKK